ncbi:MAG: hypothetical protein GY913_22645 [Proteobacteria bacterium]|nr:hypothetical protein [Pseudomonadota bacterium]MCP4919710.1 hypothetical protein [Pseudomonadota bacterium]
MLTLLLACTPTDGPVMFVPDDDSVVPDGVDSSGPGDSPSDTGDTGDTANDAEEAYQGATVFLTTWPTDAQAIVAIDVNGDELWRFDLPAELLEGDVGEPRTLSDFDVLPNGHLLFSVNPYGVFEWDRDEGMVWSVLTPAAGHDVDRLPNGDTLVVNTWARRGEPQISQYDSDGELVWSWDAELAFGDDELFADVELDGWLHLTGARRMADGSTWLCIRNFNTVARIDEAGYILQKMTLQTGDDPETVPTEGKFVGERPHGCEWIDNNHYLVATRRPDRVLEVQAQAEPRTYQQDDLETIRDVDLLPNGNVLITGNDRIVELGPSGTRLWEYVLPNDPPWDETFHPLMSAIRFGRDGGHVDRD